MKKDLKTVNRLVASWKPKLFLQDWVIFVKPGSLETDGVTAYIEPDPSYLSATLFICDNFSRLNAQEKEEVILHELLHCVASEVTELFYCLLSGEVVAKKQFNDATERLIQRLTRSILKTNAGSNES